MIYTEDLVKDIAKDAYETGDVKFLINSFDCVLLVIDMQEEFVKPEWTPYWIPEATKQILKIKKIIDKCRKNSIPIIYTATNDNQQCYDRPSIKDIMPNKYIQLSFSEDWNKWFTKVRIVDDLAPEKSDIILNKPSYGAFYNTALETILRNLECKTIIICGTLTNYSCGVTARQAYERGFKVIFGSDITSTDDMELHKNELKTLKKGFAKIMTSDDILKILKIN